jgi:hypothetical protein
MIRDLFTKIVSLKIFSGLNFILLCFFVWKLLSDAFGSRQPEISLLFELLSLPLLVLYFYLQFYAKSIKVFVPILLSLFTVFIIFESVISFQQYASKSPIGKRIEIQQDIEHTGSTADELQLEYTYRPGGTFGNTNTLAMNLVFWMTFVLSYYIKTWDRKALYILTIGFVSLVITLSRSAWLGFGASLLTMLFLYTKVIKVKIVPKFNQLILPTLLFVMPLFMLFILPRIEKSIYTFTDGGGNFRLTQIAATWEIILSRPIFGVGTSMLVVEGVNYLPKSIYQIAPLDVHNWYLSLSVNHGIPAFIVFTSFVLLSTKQIYLRVLGRKNKYPLNFLDVGFLSALSAFFIIGLFFAESGSYWIVAILGYLNNTKV